MTQIFALIRDTFKEWKEDNAARLAAALAYYTTFSLAPLLVLVIAVAGLLGGREAAQNQVMGQVRELIGLQGSEFVQSMIESASRPATGLLATAIGTVTLLFGALGAFGELQNALNTIWDVKPKPVHGLWEGIRRYLTSRLLSFAVVVGVGFLLLASLVVSAGLSSLGQYLGGLNLFAEFWLQVINLIISFAVVTLLFMLIFKFLPEVKIGWKDVALGAAVTSVLFNLGKSLIGLYLGRSSVGTTFGAAGSLAILLIWIYYSAQILFLGAEFTQVYTKYKRGRLKPGPNSERMQGRP